ncbi:SPOR domain-containing protein [bacterium]|nr:SPOR domain-containing protein [bacterium]
MPKKERVFCFVLLLLIYLLDFGCASKQITKTVDISDDVGKNFADKDSVNVTKATQEQETEKNIYDIEKELPENRVLEDFEGIEEKMPFATPDSFYVEDITKDRSRRSDYSIGFRVQIFASSNLEKAKEIKKQIESKMSMKVYIEFDDDMYKVRIGNFNSRKDASETRKTLTSLFPDCWIAETTIKK